MDAEEGARSQSGEPSISVAESLPEAILEGDDSRHARDPETFWATHIGFCPRQCYLSKLGLKDTSEQAGRFLAGSLLQDHITEQLVNSEPRLSAEARATIECGSVTFVGRPSLYDAASDTVFHIKPRNGWYKFTPPVERHLDQLHVYMAGLDADHGQLIYVSLSDFTDIKACPPLDEDETFLHFDESRFERLVDKATAIRNSIVRDGIATGEEDVPFEECGCYFCESEELEFPESPPSPSVDVAPTPTHPVSSDGGTPVVNNDTPAEMVDGSIARTHIPETLRDMDVWVVWDCQRKVALAPWQTGNMYPCEWAAGKNVDPRRPFEKAKIVSELQIGQIRSVWPFPDGEVPNEVRPAVLLPHDPPDPSLAFIDMDDVRNPDTGKITAEAQEMLDHLDCYAEVSNSGTGIHAYVRATLPETHTTFSSKLNTNGTIEIYDHSRFIGGTWTQLTNTPTRVPEAQAELDHVIQQYNDSDGGL